MGEVIDFLTAKAKRSTPIHDFKVRSEKDNEFLLNNLHRIIINVSEHDTHTESN